MSSKPTRQEPGRHVLIVTGGSRGIGAAIVRGAVYRGYSVAFSYRENSEAADALVAELSDTDTRCHAVKGDVADTDFPVALFDEVSETLGPVSAVVNNAGITGPIGSFHDVSLDTLRRVIDVNILGTMLIAQEAIRRWQAAGIPGRLVNVSSIASTLGAPGEYVHYAATKAAVDALTIGLGKEVAASGIRVNAVAPGTAYTDIHATAGEPTRPQRVVSRVPMGRIADPKEIANAVLWLLSDESSYMTGSVVRVSGGV